MECAGIITLATNHAILWLHALLPIWFSAMALIFIHKYHSLLYVTSKIVIQTGGTKFGFDR
jgi:hypothetical protein